MTNNEYKNFMFNLNNEFNCVDCPENITGEYRGCGQQNCWVTCHCKSGQDDDDI